MRRTFAPVFISLLGATVAQIANANQEQHQLALQTANAALNAGQRDADIYLMRGYALLNLGAVDEAKHMKHLAKGQNNKFSYYMFRGHLLSKDKQYNHALFWFRRALDVADQGAQTQTAKHVLGTTSARRKWVYGVQFNLRNSDNINFATTETEVELGGLPFKLDPDKRAREGTALVGIFSASYKLINKSTTLLTAGPKLNFTFDPDTGLTSRGIGFAVNGAYKLPAQKSTRLTYGIETNRTFPTDGDNSGHRMASFGINHNLSQYLTLGARVVAQQYRTTDTGYDRYGLHLNANWSTKQGHGFGLNLRAENTLSDNSNAASKAHGFGINFTPKIGKSPLTVSFFADLANQNFTLEDAFSGTYRNDKTRTVGVTVSPKSKTIMGMTPSITIKSVNRKSSIKISSAKATEVYFGLRNSF